jgi:hypothetical protein
MLQILCEIQSDGAEAQHKKMSAISNIKRKKLVNTTKLYDCLL